MIRAQIRVLESQLFNKSSELQEDISMKKFDLQTKRLHLAALRAQVSAYTNSNELKRNGAKQKGMNKNKKKTNRIYTMNTYIF